MRKLDWKYVVGIVAVAASVLAIGQGGPSATHRGSPARTGYNTTPTEPGPGASNLRWWHPLRSTIGLGISEDNSGTAYTELSGTWTTPLPAEESGDFFGSGTTPYRWSPVVASTSTTDPTAGATASAQWVITGTPGKLYALSAWFPSSGTLNGALLRPNSDYFVYRITYDGGRTFTDRVPALGGGNWVRLGKNLGNQNRIFRADATTGQITITVYNTVPLDENTGNPLGPVTNRIVCADAVLAVPDPGEIWSSPVVKNVGPTPFDDLVISVRNESKLDPSDPNQALEITSGKVYGLDGAGANISLPRWSWSPNLITNVNQVFDNSNGAVFTADAAWTQPAVPPAVGFYGADYADAAVDLTYPGSGVARWTPNTLDDQKYYDVYVWYPRSGNGVLNARGARFVIDENGTQSEFFMDQDTDGGRWIRVGTRSFLNDQALGGLKVEAWNYSNNPGDAGRRVAADAVMFVGRGDTAIYSTPTIATVDLRLSNNTVQATDCVFVAGEDGRIYCLDARGNGTGSTTVYWAWPSIPDINNVSWSDPNNTVDGPIGNRIPVPSGFGVASMVVQRIGTKDILVIGATNGYVYAIDCMGRGDYNATTGLVGTAVREWTYPRATYNGGVLTVDPPRLGFVGSVSYDATNSQIFAPSLEGRLFALDAAGSGNQQTALNWSYPALNSPTIGAISSTPAVGGGKVYFTSYDGRVYARDATGDTTPANNWVYPATGSLSPFRYTSVCYVPTAEFTDVPVAQDLVYFVNENGSAYCLAATDGTQQWTTDELAVGAFSSPYFTHMNPPGIGLPREVITFGTLDGKFVALYANPARTNGGGGRLAWGWVSTGGQVFASPAVGYSWMYHAGVDGFLYAFNDGAGQISVDPFGPPGLDLGTPDDPIDGFDDLKLKFVSPADYANLRQTPTVGDPVTMTDILPTVPIPAIEWGERIYPVAYDFIYPPDPEPKPVIRFRVSGPGGLSLQYDRTSQLRAGATPGDPGSGFATVGIPINSQGPNFLTPGEQIKVDLEVIAGGRQYNPPVLPRLITIANPLTLTTVTQYVGAPPANKSVGWTTQPDDPENIINGSNNKALMSSAGRTNHNQNGRTNWFVADRSRILELIGTGLKDVMMTRGDAAWQGGSAAVIKPLPYLPSWEQLPDFYPNLSRDYPDIDRSQLDLTADPNGRSTNVLQSGAELLPPNNYDPLNPLTREIAGVQVRFDINVEKYQPANLTGYLDAAGDTLDGGYRSNGIVFVDSNRNNRPDGLEGGLNQVPPSFRTEAYRTVNLGTSVPIDEKMFINEPTIDLGALPHSLGYTPFAPWLPANLFIPDISTAGAYNLFFQPFTLKNDGNVNMLDLRVATRIGTLNGGNMGYYPVAFSSDSNDPLAWIDGNVNIVSNINPPYAFNNGALDASGNPRATLHKARVGDRAPTVLTVPDVPYGTPAPSNSQPVVGVAVPLGFPVGEYSQIVNVVEDNFLVGGSNDRAVAFSSNGQPLEAFTDPTMRVKFINHEARLTGGTVSGSVTHVDDPLAVPTNFTFTNTGPAGFRDPFGGLHFTWTGNRPTLINNPAGSQPIDTWNLFSSWLDGTDLPNVPGQAGSSPLRDLMGWTPFSNTGFFSPFLGPYPNDPPGTLFAGVAGNIVGPPNFYDPSYELNSNDGFTGGQFSNYLWTVGEVRKDSDGDGRPDLVDNRLFFKEYRVFANGTPSLNTTGWLQSDPTLRKRRPRAIGIFSAGARLGEFIAWYADTNGVNKMYFNYRNGAIPGTGDQTANFTRNRAIDPGRGFAATWDPTPVLRQDVNTGIDLVFTGTLRDRSIPEVFYTKFEYSTTNGLGGQLNLPERNREILLRQGDNGIYRARGVNWDTRQPIEVWVSRASGLTRLDIPASRAVDADSGVVSFNSTSGGKLYCDPHTGIVRFSEGGLGAEARVELRYTPKVVRVSEINQVGGHINPSSFLDNRYASDLRFWLRSNGQPLVNTDTVRQGRYWYIYEQGASGPGQVRRPYMKTQRLGFRLNHPVALAANGTLLQPITITGAVGFAEIDPFKGRVYFTVDNEGQTITITYRYRDAAGNLQVDTITDVARWITEMDEQPVPMDQAVDESSLYAFPDPFDLPQTVEFRPSVVWLYFTSSRKGSRDVYYVSLAPRFIVDRRGN